MIEKFVRHTRPRAVHVRLDTGTEIVISPTGEPEELYDILDRDDRAEILGAFGLTFECTYLGSCDCPSCPSCSVDWDGQEAAQWEGRLACDEAVLEIRVHIAGVYSAKLVLNSRKALGSEGLWEEYDSRPARTLTPREIRARFLEAVMDALVYQGHTCASVCSGDNCLGCRTMPTGPTLESKARVAFRGVTIDRWCPTSARRLRELAGPRPEIRRLPEWVYFSDDAHMTVGARHIIGAATAAAVMRSADNTQIV